MSDNFRRSIKDCEHFRTKICPRIYTDTPDAPCGCDGRAKDFGDMGTNCDRWACFLLERDFDKMMNPKETLYLKMKTIKTTDGHEIEVVGFNPLGKLKNAFNKTDLVIDCDGNIYFPLRGHPDIYHINRKMGEKYTLKLKEIFATLKK